MGVFPFAKIHPRGKRPTRSAVCTSSPLRSLRPCQRNGASWRAGVGRVRSLAFLSILRWFPRSLLVVRDPFLTVRLIQMIEDVVGFRQHDVPILEDRNIVLARDFLNHFAHWANVGHDDMLVFDMEIRQFLAHLLTVGTPGNMIES